MHKSTARYEQSRTVRAATDQPRNEHVDASSFKETADLERSRLVAEKKGLEADIFELNARIRRAKALAWDRKVYTNPKTYQGWEFEKVKKVRRTSEIDIRLSSLKKEAADQASAEREAEGRDQYHDFSKAFHQMAKELLAGPVYDRVRIAALHTLKEAPRTP